MLKEVARLRCVAVLFIAFSCVTIASCIPQQSGPVVAAGDGTEKSVLEAAADVLDALEGRDASRLASFVHPEKGVRFSPSAYVDVENDCVLSADQITHLWTDRKTHAWGYADGSGDPIRMTPDEYLSEYVLSRNFRQPSSTNVNDDEAFGNTTNNAATVYPAGTRVEYYIRASVKDSVEQLDWAALRLVFERFGGAWFLVGVIHHRWSV